MRAISFAASDFTNERHFQVAPVKPKPHHGDTSWTSAPSGPTEQNMRDTSSTAPMTLGERLEELLRRQRMAKKELAHAIGISPSTLSRIIGGQRTPRPGELTKIATVLDVDVVALAEHTGGGAVLEQIDVPIAELRRVAADLQELTAKHSEVCDERDELALVLTETKERLTKRIEEAENRSVEAVEKLAAMTTANARLAARNKELQRNYKQLDQKHREYQERIERAIHQVKQAAAKEREKMQGAAATTAAIVGVGGAILGALIASSDNGKKKR